MKTLTIVVPLCLFLSLMSGCSFIKSKLPGDDVDQAVQEAPLVCKEVILVVVESRIKSNAVEKAITDSGCFKIVPKDSPVLSYVAQKNVVTKTKDYITKGVTAGLLPLYGAGLVVGPLAGSMATGYRVELVLDGPDKGTRVTRGWTGIGEVTRVIYFNDANAAIYDATNDAIRNLFESMYSNK